MAVTTRLTWKEERSLQNLLGNVSLGLLYKSSVHGNSTEKMLDKCVHQGPTITVIYFRNYIVGAFMLGHFPVMHQDFRKPSASFYFSFQKNESTKMTTAFLSTALKITDERLTFYSSDDAIFCVIPSKSILCMHTLLRKKLELNLSSRLIYSGWEVFRVEGIKDDAGYIRKITRATQHRNGLLAELRAYKPCAGLVSEIRILLLGPVGSGKSSFFNSVKSVFQGHVTRQATVGSDDTSITELYRIYSLKDGKDGNSLPFVLCDSMGLDEEEGVGLCMDDIPYILKGCVPDRYQFSPHKPITPRHPAFITSPSLKDRIHCVAYVLDINSVNNLSSKMVAKFKQIHKEVLNFGIAYVALLTKVNNYDEVLQDDFLNMNQSTTSQSQIMNVNKMLNIPISNILMVENYASECQLNPLKDILILSVLRQMLRAADDFLEDLPLEKTDEIA
ncbi:interferon-induced protein 44-like isoform X1 [Diceros bicornis minor]|uniref:interferon-induced protein 44-like isoform X1 n=1 Tax=Diceros bicornis minor TaxID=77932 RepID=UPI0026EAD403|nr:interferon-induced protein 44-like isoform X1 [Diceros bicornis minor]XP_058394350.1 interferon-induced protein 44-like isoform X1 [Diceros bicornis minor]